MMNGILRSGVELLFWREGNRPHGFSLSIRVGHKSDAVMAYFLFYRLFAEPCPKGYDFKKDTFSAH
ncbi:hypothetical protein M5W70_20695 [Paenibacillus larvae]|uniref:hypothetical protein n=1 Tax=Paenibacillus larvae TaxID=1464 RepID=UPI00227DFB2A|nr:hypothetical protein [Paenibacillus larvae]MCY9691017.1 hypothetical protein [Paenibacillus larvae]